MIRILDKSIADKIAAGEVIERPVSIVKEMVENALDAGASSVVVEIKHGGKSYIRVTDDGCGIPADQVETAFLRHATSKIETAEDLNAIETLGFRGEALASICAVTRCELITKCADEKLGTRLVLHGGEILTKESTGCPDGTTMVITDLFYNTPARLKFMKSDGAESGMIIDFLSQMALAYKNVKFRLINNGKILFSTTGDGNRLNSIIRIYKDVDAKNMVPLTYQEGNIALEGYISTPIFSKTTRGSQIFFVNGRVVNSKVMEKGVSLGYKERLFEGRYPVVYLFLTTDPAALDVNIHPNKREVRFDHENEIADFISRGIIAALATENAVVDAGNLFNGREEIALSGEKVFEKVLSVLHKKDSDASVSSNQFPKKNIFKYKSSDDEKKQDEEQVDIKKILSMTQNPFDKNTDEGASDQSFPLEQPITWEDKLLSETSFTQVKQRNGEKIDNKQKSESLQSSIEEIKGEKTDNEEIESKLSGPHLEISIPAMQPFDFSVLQVTGVIFSTYITAVDDKNFYLIDQHAAHERIFYEKLVGEYENSDKAKQTLMIPLLIPVSLSANANKFDWLQALIQMGFTIEDFGDNTYRVSEIPMFMDLTEAEDFIKNFIENIHQSTDLSNRVVIDKLITMSCKAAVKAHDVLKPEEITTLIRTLAKCRNPFSCPHGRPTFIKLTEYEIEKMFKRV